RLTDTATGHSVAGGSRSQYVPQIILHICCLCKEITFLIHGSYDKIYLPLSARRCASTHCRITPSSARRVRASCTTSSARSRGVDSTIRQTPGTWQRSKRCGCPPRFTTTQQRIDIRVVRYIVAKIGHG